MVLCCAWCVVQDTIDASGQPTYELLNQLDRAIHG
jgi:hypothetical protein